MPQQEFPGRGHIMSVVSVTLFSIFHSRATCVAEVLGQTSTVALTGDWTSLSYHSQHTRPKSPLPVKIMRCDPEVTVITESSPIVLNESNCACLPQSLRHFGSLVVY